MSDVLRDIVSRNKSGETIVIPSVCSAQMDVIRASLLFAKEKGRHIVIEATSNQVNQEGGYTGMRPHDFVSKVHDVADECRLEREYIIFGGDHLGPQAWRHLPAAEAMDKAHVMMREYVQAGFGKIHLDCSEGCLGEAAQLDDMLTAQRSAALAATSLEHSEDLLFVVGTEVPPPGGARAGEDDDIVPTKPEDARATLETHIQLFGDMAKNIGGLVVQPGVEFGAMDVHHLPPNRDPKLKEAISDYPNVCLEAHSTDYQLDAAYPHLAQLGFAFQKVGPALSFAYRKALYQLDFISSIVGRKPPFLAQAMEDLMQKNPSFWVKHYCGDDDQIRTQLHFGLADRIRYYWPMQEAQKAVANLRHQFSKPLPDAVLLQGFDRLVLDKAENLTGTQFDRILLAEIQMALEPYFFTSALERAR